MHVGPVCGCSPGPDRMLKHPSAIATRIYRRNQLSASPILMCGPRFAALPSESAEQKMQATSTPDDLRPER